MLQNVQISAVWKQKQRGAVRHETHLNATQRPYRAKKEQATTLRPHNIRASFDVHFVGKDGRFREFVKSLRNYDSAERNDRWRRVTRCGASDCLVFVRPPVEMEAVKIFNNEVRHTRTRAAYIRVCVCVCACVIGVPSDMGKTRNENLRNREAVKREAG